VHKINEAAFLDISEAFDKVWHTGLLYKLRKSLPHNYYLILKSYLHGRHFNVNVAQQYTELFPVKTGVSQGSVIKEDSHWLHPTTTYNRYVALSDDKNIDHLQKVATDSTPKLPPIFVSYIITILPLLKLLGQIVKQRYEIKTLAGNQVRIQPKTPDTYRAIIKALAGKKHDIPYLQT
jgi:hypothetical protein